MSALPFAFLELGRSALGANMVADGLGELDFDGIAELGLGDVAFDVR